MYVAEGNIILEYNHPYIKTVIYDNSAPVLEVPEVDNGVKFLSVIQSSKGQDGVFLKFKNTEDFIEEYGNPNFKLHGQPIYNAYAALKSRVATVYCMRVMPSDALIANLIMIAKYKVDNSNPDEPKMILKHEIVSFPGLNNKDDFEYIVDEYDVDSEDEEGFKSIPLMGFYALGRGQYGNSLRIRMTSIVDKRSTIKFKTYRLEIMELQQALTVKEHFQASLYEDAVSNNISFFYEDIVNDAEDGSRKINMYVNPLAIETLFDVYKNEIDPSTQMPIGYFDPLFGINNNLQPIPGLVVEPGDLAIDRLEGIALENGHDGSLTVDENMTVENELVHDDVVDQMYLDAFNGITNSVIGSKRRMPVRFILDAGYSQEVKRAMVALALKRYDAFLHLDSGLLTTATELLYWGQEMYDVDDRIISKNAQCWQIRDPFSGKRIPVTQTYMLASLLPNHIYNIGDQVPLVGEKYAKLTGAIKNTLMPIIDGDDLELKDNLYDLRVNYIEAIDEQTFIRATQQTSQQEETDCSEEHNVYMLLNMKRIIERKMQSLLYNFAEPEDRVRFADEANNALRFYKEKVRGFQIRFAMSPYEEERSILHCYLDVVFKTIAKRGVIEINIHNRILSSLGKKYNEK
jgi:hypothetical protein